jgi:hypothetical protein
MFIVSLVVEPSLGIAIGLTLAVMRGLGASEELDTIDELGRRILREVVS